MRLPSLMGRIGVTVTGWPKGLRLLLFGWGLSDKLSEERYRCPPVSGRSIVGLDEKAATTAENRPVCLEEVWDVP